MSHHAAGDIKLKMQSLTDNEPALRASARDLMEGVQREPGRVFSHAVYFPASIFGFSTTSTTQTAIARRDYTVEQCDSHWRLRDDLEGGDAIEYIHSRSDPALTLTNSRHQNSHFAAGHFVLYFSPDEYTQCF